MKKGYICKNIWSSSHLLTLVPRSRIFIPWRWRRLVPPKRRFTQHLHGATSQKTAFFIVTAVKTSNFIFQIAFTCPSHNCVNALPRIIFKTGYCAIENTKNKIKSLPKLILWITLNRPIWWILEWRSPIIKVKFYMCLNGHKTCKGMGEWRQAPRYHKLGTTSSRQMVCFTLRSLYLKANTSHAGHGSRAV
jgi:hypothetical protein